MYTMFTLCSQSQKRYVRIMVVDLAAYDKMGVYDRNLPCTVLTGVVDRHIYISSYRAYPIGGSLYCCTPSLVQSTTCTWVVLCPIVKVHVARNITSTSHSPIAASITMEPTCAHAPCVCTPSQNFSAHYESAAAVRSSAACHSWPAVAESGQESTGEN